jgi:hypothetical protein
MDQLSIPFFHTKDDKVKFPTSGMTGPKNRPVSLVTLNKDNHMQNQPVLLQHSSRLQKTELYRSCGSLEDGK